VPQGRHAIYLQPPEGGIPRSEDGQHCLAQAFSDINTNLELSEEQHQYQYSTLIEVIEVANAMEAAKAAEAVNALPVQQLVRTRSSRRMYSHPLLLRTLQDLWRRFSWTKPNQISRNCL
jgi:hypothetical protein